MVWEPAKAHRRKTFLWWKGKTVRLLREIRNNGGGVMKKGSKATVEDKYGGLALAGSGTYTTRVGYGSLEVCVPDNAGVETR